MAKKLSKRRDLRRNVVDWYGDDFIDIVEKATPDALFKAGTIVLEAARGRAPKRTGELVRSGFVLTEKRDNYVRGRADRKNIRSLISTFRRPQTVTIMFAAWYSNLFEDTGRKRNISPRAYRKQGEASVKKARSAIKYAMRFNKALKIQKTLKIPGIGYRTKVTIPRMKSRPFLAPALEETKAQFTEALCGEVRGELERGMPAA